MQAEERRVQWPDGEKGPGVPGNSVGIQWGMMGGQSRENLRGDVGQVQGQRWHRPWRLPPRAMTWSALQKQGWVGRGELAAGRPVRSSWNEPR